MTSLHLESKKLNHLSRGLLVFLLWFFFVIIKFIKGILVFYQDLIIN